MSKVTGKVIVAEPKRNSSTMANEKKVNDLIRKVNALISKDITSEYVKKQSGQTMKDMLSSSEFNSLKKKSSQAF